MNGTWKSRVLGRTGLIGLVAGAAVLGAAVGGVAYAQTPPDTQGGTPFLTRLAQKLGLSEDRVTQAFRDVRSEMLDEAIAAGRITPERADQMRQAPIGQGGMPGFGPRGGHDGMPGHAGKGGPGMMRGHLDSVATFLGLTADQLREEMRQGKSLAEVAQAKGISRQALIDRLNAEMSNHLAQAVQDGKLTQEQANQMLERGKPMVEQMIDAKPGQMGPGGGRHGGPGMRGM